MRWFKLIGLLLLAAPVLAGRDGLAPRFDTRYRVVDEQWASLDGAHRYRIPTLRALDERSGGPPMLVAVYEQGEEGERAVGTAEGEDVHVERIADVDGDGKPELVIRVGTGADCVGCSHLVVFTMRGNHLVDLAEGSGIHDLVDVDSDGRFEGIALATSLIGAAGLPLDHTPRVEQVWTVTKRGFRADDQRYARYHWRRLMETRRLLESGGPGRAGYEQVSLAITLYFEHEILGKPADGFVIASRFLRQVRDHSDRITQISAEKALDALEARSKRQTKATR